MSQKVGRGFGLAGMRERVAMIGGRLTIEDAPGKSGVTLTADLPLSRKIPLHAETQEDKAGVA